MPNLRVLKIATADVYKDIIRVPARYRKDINGDDIEEATVCWVGGTPRRTVVVVRGSGEKTEPSVWMDDKTRAKLGVQPGKFYELQFERAGLWGQLVWALNASEVAYRIASQLGVAGLILGFLGFIPTLLSWTGMVLQVFRLLPCK